MNIQKVILDNVGIITHLEFEVESVVLIEGDNGTGKSTVIRAIETTLDGGHHPTLVGPAGPEATVELIFDEGTTVRRVTKLAFGKRKVGTSEYIVTRADGSEVPSPAAYVQGLVSGLWLNPADFLHAGKEERLKFLQKAIDVRFTREELEKATGELYPQHQDGIDLKRFKEFKDGRFNERTHANSKVKVLSAHRTELARNIPASADGRDWALEEQSLAQRVTELRQEIHGLASDKQDALREAIHKAENETNEAIRNLELALKERIAHMRTEADRIHEAEYKPLAAQLEGLVADHATAKANALTQAQAASAKESLARTDIDVKTAVQYASTLDRQVKALEELETRKLAQMPIPGLEVREGGEVYYDNLHFDTQVNTALQLLVSFKIAKAGGMQPFWVFDNAEVLAAGNRDEFIEGVKKLNMRVVMAAVADGQPLTVRQL